MSRLPRCLGALAAAFILCGPPAARAASTPPDWRPFAADSAWNQPLRADAPVDPASAEQVRWLQDRIAEHGTWINTGSCGMPMYWADADTPTVKVTLDPSAYQDRVLIGAWSQVPMPAAARPANCADKNFAVLQRQPDGTVSMWEFWSATKHADGTWSARWGGATKDVLADRGIASTLSWNDPTATATWLQNSTSYWNVTATSISMAAGVMTHEEMARGSIDHALAMATTDAAAGRWTWPAQRTDGGSTDPAALPEGARLRLDPALDLDTLTLTPLVRMMARAAQRYGIVIRDRTYSANVFYAEEPHEGETSPVRALNDGKWPNNALAAFPWSRLQVVAGHTCTQTPCTVDPQVVIDVDTAEPRVGERVDLDTSRSVLEHGRTQVEWDLDGDGTHETDAGRAVELSYTPADAGPRTVGVRITTRDGVVTSGAVELDVAPPRDPVVRVPSAARGTWFYSYSSAYSLLGSISATTQPPATPDRYRRAYTSTASGALDVDLSDEGVGSPGDATLRAWVDCAPTRCLRLSVLDAQGATRAVAEPAWGSSGWVTVRVPGPLTAAEADGLRLRATARNAPSASGAARIGAVSLTGGWR